MTEPTGPTAERVAFLLARPTIKPDEILEIGPVGRTTVQLAISSGELPSHKIGRARLVRTADAVAWLTGGQAA